MYFHSTTGVCESERNIGAEAEVEIRDYLALGSKSGKQVIRECLNMRTGRQQLQSTLQEKRHTVRRWIEISRAPKLESVMIGLMQILRINVRAAAWI
jgi:hypothetical protein